MTSDHPVFIVGLPRSGTTLLTAMLSAHSRLDSGPETHFFTHLRRASVTRITDPHRWPVEGMRFLTEIAIDGRKLHDIFEVSCAELETFLRKRPPSVRALLESVMAVRAARRQKARWIEKTPNHLLHLDRIRFTYPEAHIIRIIRDPRDVALSLRRVPFASPSVLANLYSWVERDERSWRFFEKDRRSITVRYEDLVTDPRKELCRLCDFLGESFEAGMLQPQGSAQSVITSGEWWKANVQRPVSGERVQAWRRELSEGEQEVASLVCAEPCARYDYADSVAAVRTFQCQPLNAEFIEQNETVLIELARQGVRLRPWDAKGVPEIVWGAPRQLRWSLGKTLRDRALSAASISVRLAAHRLRGKRVVWIAEDSGVSPRRGLLDAACNFGLRVSARRTGRQALYSHLSRGSPDRRRAATAS